MKRLEVYILPLDRMLVHRRSHPRNLSGFPNNLRGTHLYTWVERGTVRVKCLAQEHNTMSPARARTRTTHSGVEHTNHEGTVPPTTGTIGKPIVGTPAPVKAHWLSPLTEALYPLLVLFPVAPLSSLLIEPSLEGSFPTLQAGNFEWRNVECFIRQVGILQ